MEEAITPLIKAQVQAAEPDVNVPYPVDLLLLINEAGPAQLARPLLVFLQNNHVTYKDDQGNDYPLLLSMTSEGDSATKFAFPAGAWLSSSRPTNGTALPDQFGLKPETWYLLATANTVALQNRKFVQQTSAPTLPTKAFVTIDVNPPTARSHEYFNFIPIKRMLPKVPVHNNTPYWVSQLPQIFVPDHGSIFGYQFMRLLNEFVSRGHYTGQSALLPACASQATFAPFALPRIAASPPPPPLPRSKIMLEKHQ